VPGLPSRTAQETLPWSWYSEPELLRREQERIFRRAWQYAGPAEHVSSPGDFFTCRVSDVPVIVVRDRELHVAHFQGLVREALV
jgi:phenylpropionate dioxygenase-like ring-hydroxylating dioxygenase large terminal subunit